MLLLLLLPNCQNSLVAASVQLCIDIHWQRRALPLLQREAVVQERVQLQEALLLPAPEHADGGNAVQGERQEKSEVMMWGGR